MLNKKTSLIILMGILGLALVLRAHNLGGPDFGPDEVFHVFAAQSVQQGQGLILPSGFTYKRAALYTYTVAGFTGLLGFNEATARIASVFFSLLSLLVLYFLVKIHFDTKAALWTIFFAALIPMEIAMSREVRMYSMFEFFYLLTLLLFFSGFEAKSVLPIEQRFYTLNFRNWCERFQISPILLLSSATSALIALHAHSLTAVGLSGVFTYILVMAIAVSMRSYPWLLRSKYYVVVGLAIISLMILVIFLKNLWMEFRELAQYAPNWAKNGTMEWKYYRNLLATDLPTIFGGLFISLVYCFTRRIKITLFLSLCFLAPFILHSTVFAWKAERYIFYVVPLLVIFFGVSFSPLMDYLFHSLANSLKNFFSTRLAHALSFFTLSTAVFFFLINTPWFIPALKLSKNEIISDYGVSHNHWRTTLDYVKQRSNAQHVLVSTFPLIALYYAPEYRNIYHLNDFAVDIMQKVNLRDKQGRLIDYGSGAVILADISMLKEVMNKYPCGWFITEKHRYENTLAFPKELAPLLSSQFSRHEVPLAPDMLLWQWPARANQTKTCE